MAPNLRALRRAHLPGHSFVRAMSASSRKKR
jgi:hypothetical protein